MSFVRYCAIISMCNCWPFRNFGNSKKEQQEALKHKPLPMGFISTNGITMSPSSCLSCSRDVSRSLVCKSRSSFMDSRQLGFSILLLVFCIWKIFLPIFKGKGFDLHTLVDGIEAQAALCLEMTVAFLWKLQDSEVYRFSPTLHTDSQSVSFHIQFINI